MLSCLRLYGARASRLRRGGDVIGNLESGGVASQNRKGNKEKDVVYSLKLRCLPVSLKAELEGRVGENSIVRGVYSTLMP